MTTETKKETEQQEEARAAFDAYAAARETAHHARMPAHLQVGAPLPPTWPFGPETWERFRDAAAKLYAREPLRDFLLQFVKGWTLREVLGDRDFRQEVYADGSPVRRQPSQVSPQLLAAADQALGEAQARALRLDDLTAFTLERALDSSPAKVKAAIQEVRQLVAAYDFQKHAEVDAGVSILVHTEFTGPGGISYYPGRQQVSAEEAQALAKWLEQKGVERDRHGWDAPHNFTPETWPPFSLEGTATAALWEPSS